MLGSIFISSFILKFKKIFADLHFAENITSNKTFFFNYIIRILALVVLHQKFAYRLKKGLLFFLRQVT